MWKPFKQKLGGDSRRSQIMKGAFNMKPAFVALVGAWFFLAGIAEVFAGDVGRTARLEDTAGVTTDVTELKFFGDHNMGDNARFRLAETIVVVTDSFEVAVPFGSLISVTPSGKAVKVTYSRLGKERHLSGTLGTGTFYGKTEFGDIRVQADKVKSLVFTDLPAVKDAKAEETSLDNDPVPATIVLADNTAVPVRFVRRYAHYSEYSTVGYVIGGETRYYNWHYKDFRFRRGEVKAVIEFDKLKSIVFSTDRQGQLAVTVTLKSGTASPGTLSNDNEERVDGFTGVNDDGEFFIRPERIKAIRFGADDSRR
jgi:hypothetical protein